MMKLNSTDRKFIVANFADSDHLLNTGCLNDVLRAIDDLIIDKGCVPLNDSPKTTDFESEARNVYYNIYLNNLVV